MDRGGLRTKNIVKQAAEDKPLFTAVTAVQNGKKHLEETIRSVLSQTYGYMEYIIIDGESTDGTMDIIHRYEDRIDYWLSEPDEGVYHAMNKGIRLAKGSVIGLLNADDAWFPETVETVMQEFARSGAGICYGNVEDRLALGGTALKRIRKPDIGRMERDMGLIHPAVFVKKQVYDELGGYDEHFRISGDYEFLLRALRAGCKFHYIDKPLTHFRLKGMSHSKCTSIIEGHRAMKMHRTGHHHALKWRLVKCLFRKFFRAVAYGLSRPLGFEQLFIKRAVAKWNKSADDTGV